MNHVTIATASGAIWLVLVSHFWAGLVGIVSGAIALFVAKGGQAHKRSGIVFAYAMAAAGFGASIIAFYEGKTGMVIGGLSIVYFVFTATATVKPPRRFQRPVDSVLMVLILLTGAFTLQDAATVWGMPGHARAGVPAGMMFFLGTVYVLSGIGDLRIIRAGGITGSRRLARHLWRMCFALFIATGSFFLGQMKFIPASIRFVPVLFGLALAPLIVLLYWMWRVRFRKRLAGFIIAPRADPSLRSG